MKSAGNRRTGRAVQATKHLNCATSPIAVADKDDKKARKDAPSATPRFDPKPVQVGGESLIERLTPHVKKIAIVLVGIAVVLTVVFTVRYFKQRDRQKATAKFARVMEVAEREVKEPGAPDDPKAKEPKFNNAKERALAVLSEIEKQGTNLAGPAFRGSLLHQADKVDEAIAEYKTGTSAKGIDGVLAREGLGIALEEKALAAKDATARQAGLDEALKAFQSMQPDEKGPRAAYAAYHQGRILAHMQKWPEARAAFEKAKTLGAEGELPTMIDEHLAGLGGS
jgi:predicted negative regulator of RcsB-dependent stress response